jgi:hypothetical protein
MVFRPSIWPPPCGTMEAGAKAGFGSHESLGALGGNRILSNQHTARFNTALQRLTDEAHTLRCDYAALDSWRARRREYHRSRLVTLMSNALKSDLMIRLCRVFEKSKNVASFWYLHRCEPDRVARDLDKLRYFSDRVKLVRDKAFVHIDKTGVFDPESYYREAAITYDEIRDVIEDLWRTIGRLQAETFTNPNPKIILCGSRRKQHWRKDFLIFSPYP